MARVGLAKSAANSIRNNWKAPGVKAPAGTNDACRDGVSVFLEFVKSVIEHVKTAGCYVCLAVLTSFLRVQGKSEGLLSSVPPYFHSAASTRL